MDYFKNVFTIFLVSMLHSVGLRELLDFIKHILICVPKILQVWDDMRGSNDIIFTQLHKMS